ncbi:hypothetical protein [Stutzerimonas stutzeri]|uniref:hypothetical protein n=1 Tax=Stutzerimonas stutzeri TaxID=316 RepID=UPI000C9C7956|nr:hypothetical protein [Stutzerimonas stutzeri]PNG11880.1 hypothetical protein CXK97_19345 [Stutzerimonas stutzeri]
MSKHYRPGELKAGKTFFVGALHFSSLEPYVIEHIVGSKAERLPEIGEISPYRMNPAELQWINHRWLFKTRKAAIRDALKRAKLFSR